MHSQHLGYKLRDISIVWLLWLSDRYWRLLFLLSLALWCFVASQVFNGFVAWDMVNFNHCSMFVFYCEGMRRVVLNCQGRVSQGAKVRLLSQEMVFGFGWLHGLVNGFQYIMPDLRI